MLTATGAMQVVSAPALGRSGEVFVGSEGGVHGLTPDGALLWTLSVGEEVVHTALLTKASHQYMQVTDLLVGFDLLFFGSPSGLFTAVCLAADCGAAPSPSNAKPSGCFVHASLAFLL